MITTFSKIVKQIDKNYFAMAAAVAVCLLLPLNAFSQGAGFLIDLARRPPTSNLGQLNANLGQPQNTFLVTNLNDSGAGSLRQAVLDANAGAGYDAINFQSGLTGTIALTGGQLQISDSVKIEGPGADIITVSGNNRSRVLRISNSITPPIVSISGITIANGFVNSGIPAGSGIDQRNGLLSLDNVTVTQNSVNDGGGGIYSFGELTVNNSVISDNSAGLAGGGIYANTRLTVSNSIITNNSAGGAGGGIFIASNVQAEIRNSAVSYNTASQSGGGIFNDNDVLTIVNSSVSNNTSNSVAGIYNASGTLNLINSTVSSNSSNLSAGGIFNGSRGELNVLNSTVSHNSVINGFSGGIFNGGTANIGNTIIAANEAPIYFDVMGIFNSWGNNLIGSTMGNEGFTGGVNGDKVGNLSNPLDPRLGDLRNNGGTTATRALLAGSPAINAGNNCVVRAVENGGCLNPSLTTDQRGLGFARQLNETVDIGAFESIYTNQPTDIEQCKKGGWQFFNNPRAFKNQGDCIQFVNTGK